MTYRALDVDTVLAYAKDQPELASHVPDASPITTREIGDGNLNLVFVLETEAGSGIIVKQALPYLRVAGESWPLTRDRMRFEIQALKLYHRQVTGLVPEVFHANPSMSLVAMEFLKEHRVLRDALTDGELPVSLSAAIGRFMATTHFLNSDLHLEGEAKKARQVEFSNPHLCRLQEDFVFTNPFMESPENDSSGLPDAWVASLRSDPALKTSVLRTKTDYLTHAQTLLHGDLHTGSIMAAGDDVRVIDPEFAFYGPAAYDVGTFLAHLAIAALAADHHAPSQDEVQRRQRYAVATLQDTWKVYRRTTHELWNDELGRGVAPEAFWLVDDAEAVQRAWLDERLDDIGRDSVRHAGCEVLRRLLGIVTTGELSSIDDAERRQEIEVKLARLARRWLVTAAADVSIDWMSRTLAASVADEPER